MAIAVFFRFNDSMLTMQIVYAVIFAALRILNSLFPEPPVIESASVYNRYQVGAVPPHPGIAGLDHQMVGNPSSCCWQLTIASRSVAAYYRYR
jgi:hypothetical protein